MQIMPEEVNVVEKVFWNELTMAFKPEDVFKIPFSSMVKEIISERSIKEDSIIEFSYKETNSYKHKFNKNQRVAEFFIKYLTIDLKELRSKPQEEQIRIILCKLGYTDEHVKKIEFCKLYNNSDELCWHASINHDDFHFDPDESYSERDFYGCLYNMFDIVFDFKLRVN